MMTKTNEDAGTARIVARVRRQVAAGMPLIPMEFANRIADGENPIRVIREWRDVPQGLLMRRTALGQGYISDLERGARTATMGVYRQIAKELRVPVEMILPD